MKRVDIKYDGGEYSIGGRHIDDVQAEIDAAFPLPSRFGSR